MSEAYRESVRLYWIAKRTDASNREFNVESEKTAIHDNYLACLRILATYSRTHEGSVLAYSIWGGRKRLGLKFQGRTVTIGGVKNGIIPVGVTREIISPMALRRFLENTMRFTVANLNEGIFEKAYKQLRRIESEKKIRIDIQETKAWSMPR